MQEHLDAVKAAHAEQVGAGQGEGKEGGKPMRKKRVRKKPQAEL